MLTHAMLENYSKIIINIIFLFEGSEIYEHFFHCINGLRTFQQNR